MDNIIIILKYEETANLNGLLSTTTLPPQLLADNVSKRRGRRPVETHSRAKLTASLPAREEESEDDDGGRCPVTAIDQGRSPPLKSDSVVGRTNSAASGNSSSSAVHERREIEAAAAMSAVILPPVEKRRNGGSWIAKLLRSLLPTTAVVASVVCDMERSSGDGCDGVRQNDAVMILFVGSNQVVKPLQAGKGGCDSKKFRESVSISEVTAA
nr:hypothetical protein Iba_chr09dCG15400 [Ipomoea batatas]